MIDMDTDWSLIDFDKPEKAPIPLKHQCPKCGKKLGRGGHKHVKACDGHPAKAG